MQTLHEFMLIRTTSKDSDFACPATEINETSKKNEKQLLYIFIYLYIYMFRSISKKKEIDFNDSPHFLHFDTPWKRI